MRIPKILILGRREERSGFETPELYEKYLPKRMVGYELTFGHFDNLEFFCSKNHVKILLNDVDIKHFDKVYIFGWYKDWKDIAYAIAYYLNWHNIKILNTEALYQRSSGKVSQAVLFGLNGLSIPKTYFCKDGHDILKASEAVGGFPLIAKQYDGNKGKHNYLVKSKEELDEIIAKEDEDVHLLYQQFIQNEGDMRVIFANGKVRLVLKRQAQDKNTHLHNISQGAKGSYLDVDYLDEGIKNDIAQSAMLLHRELSGLDVVQSIDDGKFYILESNNLPQMASWDYHEKHLDVLAEALKNL